MQELILRSQKSLKEKCKWHDNLASTLDSRLEEPLLGRVPSQREHEDETEEDMPQKQQWIRLEKLKRRFEQTDYEDFKQTQPC